MAQTEKKNKHDNDNDINISRVRRAIDFWPEFTGGERLVAGVIADHFNSDEGYAFPGYRYLTFVYGFSSDTIASAVAKLRNGLMKIKRSRKGNNCYEPDMQKVEAILADLETARQRWKEQKDASSDEAEMLRPAKQGASSRKARVLRKKKRNVQPNVQPERPTFPTLDASHGETRDLPSEGDRPSGGPAEANSEDADRTEYVESLTEAEFISILESEMPAYEPFEDYKQQKQRSKERGPKYQLRNLIRLGWRRLEILDATEAYLKEHDNDPNAFRGNGQCGLTLGKLLSQLSDQTTAESRWTEDGEFYGGWRIPSRFLNDAPAPAAANNNQTAAKAAGDDWPPF